MWIIDRTDEFKKWILSLDDDSKVSILGHLKVLAELGPKLGRPYVDTLKESKFKNMKELRVQSKRKVFRILFIFDQQRKALLIIGGDKRGKKRFYKEMIPLADKIYEKYLNRVTKNGKKTKKEK